MHKFLLLIVSLAGAACCSSALPTHVPQSSSGDAHDDALICPSPPDAEPADAISETAADDCPDAEGIANESYRQHALPRVYQHLLSLRRQLRELERHEDSRGARRVQQQIAELERRLRCPVGPPKHSEPVVHAVGVYSQSNAAKPVRVQVTDTSGPIVLVLSGYSSIMWKVELSEDVQIDFVICTGYEQQQVIQLPDGIPVFSFSYSNGSEQYAYAYGDDRSQWKSLESFVAQQTGGLPIRTALGSYHSRDQPYVVGPENVDWRVRVLDQELNADN